MFDNKTIPVIDCKTYDSKVNFKLAHPITVSHVDDWDRKDPTLLGAERVIDANTTEQDASIYELTPATPHTPNAQEYVKNGKHIWFIAKQRDLTFKKTYALGNLGKANGSAGFFSLKLVGESAEWTASGIAGMGQPSNAGEIAPWGAYASDLSGSGKYEIFEKGTTTPAKLPLHLFMHGIDGGGVARDISNLNLPIGEKVEVTIDGTFSNTKYDSLGGWANGNNPSYLAGNYAYLANVLPQAKAVYDNLKNTIPPTINGKSNFVYNAKTLHTLNGTQYGDGIHGGDSQINADFTGSSVDVKYALNESGSLEFNLLQVNDDPDLIPIKVDNCKQEIVVDEYQSGCNGLDCNYKKTQTTKLWRRRFNYEGETNYTYSTWFWQDRNLKDLNDTYQFDGNIIVGLQTGFPWIAEGSYRKELQLVEVYLFSDSCSDCGDTGKKQDGYKYELVVPKKFTAKHCMDKEQPKTYQNCLKVDRPHWKKTQVKTESNLCNWTAYDSHCQVRFNYLNKQQLRLEIIKGANMVKLEDFLKNHKFDKINNCGMSAILDTTDKTLYGAVNEIGLDLVHLLDKSVNLQKIANTPYSVISKI